MSGEDYEHTDSNEEVYFEWWLEELKEAGYVSYFRRCQSFTLAPKVERVVHIRRPRSVKRKAIEIIPEVTYTPDYLVEWAEPAIGLFVLDMDRGYTAAPSHHLWGIYGSATYMSPPVVHTWIEVKGMLNLTAKMLDMKNREAKLRAAWLYHRHGMIVSILRLGPFKRSLFDRTFTPKRFLLCDRTAKPRKLHFKPRTLQEFVAGQVKIEPEQLII